MDLFRGALFYIVEFGPIRVPNIAVCARHGICSSSHMSKHHNKARHLLVAEAPPHVLGLEESWMHSEMGHRGHGPKNYTRPDERIREEVCEMLTYHDGVDARDIEVIVDRGEVTLAGSVTSHTMKVVALESVAAIHGVARVNDRLRESGEVDAQTPAR